MQQMASRGQPDPFRFRKRSRRVCLRFPAYSASAKLTVSCGDSQENGLRHFTVFRKSFFRTFPREIQADPHQYMSHQSHGSINQARDSSTHIRPPVGAEYTCPRHPANPSHGSGNCPICGVDACEPVIPEWKREENPAAEGSISFAYNRPSSCPHTLPLTVIVPRIDAPAAISPFLQLFHARLRNSRELYVELPLGTTPRRRYTAALGILHPAAIAYSHSPPHATHTHVGNP